MNKILIILLIVSTLILAACTVNQNNPDDIGTVCTMEAKLCSDGTSVGRNSSNNCAFDPCPDEKNYVSTDLEKCKVIRFVCSEGKEYFSDDKGCGCRPVEKVSTCGNGVCEVGEADECPACINSTPPCLAPCTKGTCNEDCVSTGKLKAIDCTNPRPTACTREYMPVCGQVQVQCIRAPCPLVKETFANKCTACANSLTISYTDGACEDDLAGGTVPAGNQGEQCTNIGGTWSEDYKECTGVSSEQCQEIGGTFNECASACRNDPNAQVCTMQCVQVCEFN
jgi:hypothetical protein